MHQQNWQELWNLFVAVMAAEPIHIRLGIGVALAFLTVMSLTGIADSFLPRRAARRYAAMYDMMPAVRTAATPQPAFVVVPPAEEPQPEEAPSPDAPPLELEADAAPPQIEEPENDGTDLRYAQSVNAQAYRRSLPSQPKVLRQQKP
jgi:hypothetical protein